MLSTSKFSENRAPIQRFPTKILGNDIHVVPVNYKKSVPQPSDTDFFISMLLIIVFLLSYE